jgi:ubiquinone biosynthesis protein
VKLGQLLSTRSDITPPRVQQELSKLQDHAPSIPAATLAAELKRSLGSTDLFATFEMAPVACASIGQVHRATLKNGLSVAVKVRRPGIRADIDADFWFLRKFAGFVARLSSRMRAYDPVGILDEFAVMVRAETDFTAEAGNLEAVHRTFAESDAVTIPRVITDMSDDSLLVRDRRSSGKRRVIFGRRSSLVKRGLLWVIRDQVEPAISATMSAIPRKRPHFAAQGNDAKGH